MIGRTEIAALIPHAGKMCLLERVVSWDGTRILCVTDTHRVAGNPMARNGVLAAVCGVEYAAQAMAVHGALTGGGDRPRVGYLASVRDVECAVARLDQLDGELKITAEQLHGEAGRVIYGFALTCAGRDIVSGRAAVVLSA